MFIITWLLKILDAWQRNAGILISLQYMKDGLYLAHSHLWISLPLQELSVPLWSRPVSFREVEMRASLVATDDTTEALNQSGSVIIQNLVATLANSLIPFGQGYLSFSPE